MLRAIGCLIITFCLTPALFQNASVAYQQKEEKEAKPAVVYACPMHPEVQSSTPGNCPKCEMKLIVEEQKKEEEIPEGAEEYTCPMHPEIRTAAAGKCPKCEMKLMPANPGITDEFDLKFEVSPRPPKMNEKVRFRFTISNPKTGEQVKQFAEMHDRLFHLFVVSQDMSDFQHIHPTMEKDGSFTIETVLRQVGNYKIYSDIYPVEGAPQVIQRDLVTAGYKSDLFAALPSLKPDTVLAKTVEGMRVTPEEAGNAGVEMELLPSGDFGPIKVELTLDPEEVIAGRFVSLKYHLTDAKTGEPVRDLVPYLGAWGHTLILSEDQTDYVHSHPEQNVPAASDRSKSRGGPDVTFDALIPRPGVYRIWTQFLRGNRLATVNFTVRAERLR
ncbi:MAG: hypothetical protein L0229_00625 [Blastocatellia bacterium]|nr:hypothetical protein [Blastocatellia bacterium]